jgi:hypothetical protein
MTINGGIFLLQQVYNRQVSKTWPITAPGITTPISNLSTINEGGSVVVNVGTTDYEGQTLYWTISGVTGTIDSSDFTAISGSFTVEANNFGYFTITTTEDVTTEGTESFVVQIRTDSTSGPIKATSVTITINDTSIEATQRGWFFGGLFSPSTIVSTTERITFSNDTQTAVTRGNLTRARRKLIVSQSSTNSYIMGGLSPVTTESSIERFSFSNDTSSTTLLSSIFGSNLVGYTLSTAVEDSTYCWLGGGYPGVRSTIHRLTFSSDSSNTVVRSNLSSSRYGLTSVDNDTFGWWGGGLSATSLIDRTTFSTDTTNAISRGRLSATRSYFASSKNATYGWFLGGGPSPIKSTVDRLTFSSDTTNNSVRGPLVNAVRFSSATGNSNYGWNAGGEFPSVSIVSRIDYASDTATSSSRGPLTVSKTEFSDHGTTAVA